LKSSFSVAKLAEVEERISMQEIQRQAIGRCVVAALITWLLGSVATAQDALEGRIILEVSGAISTEDPNGKILFDIEKLESLGLYEIITETPWTDGPVRFEGVRGQDLMDYVGASGATISATAINDYTVEIPTSDFAEFGAIFATRIDGNLMTVRNRGPVWIIYPWSSTPEIQNEVYYTRSIWQLNSFFVNGN
jgi:hypothetical protein